MKNKVKSRQKSKTSEYDKMECLIYSVQEHYSRRLHWDLRLEYPKKGLLSWAIPKKST